MMFPKDTHILIVDDSANIRRIIADSLKRAGFNKIDTAADAKIAFEKMQRKQGEQDPFQLILSDLNMPGPSGIDFLKQIRQHADFGEVPFILVTTESEKGSVLEAAVNGVSSYIVKPFDINTVDKKLNEAWNKHGAKLFKA